MKEVGEDSGALGARARRLRRLLPALAGVIAAVAVAACGSSNSSSTAGAPAGGSSTSAATTAATGSGSATGSATGTSTGTGTGAAGAGLKTGLNMYVVPKLLGAAYFTVADSVGSGGACAAAKQLGEKCSETSGSAATPSSELPAIQAAISKGANALVVSATDPTALCPTLNAAIKRGITVVTYDSDAPTCRQLFVNQASTAEIGTSEVDLIAKEMHDQGQLGIVSAAASATNQNAWISYMKQELKKYPKIQLVSIVYGNDDPTTATQVTNGLLQKYPHLGGIISPTTVGIAAAAAILDTSQYRGKVKLTGLGTPLAMKKFVQDGTIQAFELWNPANLGYLAAYAAVELASKKITGAQGESFTAGKLGKFTVGADHTIILGPPTVFTKANIGQFHF
jgi:rhamnose transport system substrate-binding protein